MLYANPASKPFARLFLALHELAAPPTGTARIQLGVRWKPLASRPADARGKLALTGYGALLDIKKVDYITIDDRANKAGSGAGYAAGLAGHGPRIYPVGEEDVSSQSSLLALHQHESCQVC